MIMWWHFVDWLIYARKVIFMGMCIQHANVAIEQIKFYKETDFCIEVDSIETQF